ncbi:MAG TPA: PD-(D/E)XK nuclease family protein, partial [Solirubrobacterales bacterium]|nr:PD-(D/E)XK nuclease family protein [Solirubrobacterales bacterium]
WFVNHELNPRPIEPDPEPLETGGIVHDALEHLYADPPAGQRPTEESLSGWIEAGRSRLRESATEREWDLASPRARIALARLDAVIARFLRRDAETGGPMQPDSELLEAAFGLGPDDPHPPAEIGDFKLHGRVDRIDVSTDGKALIRDYKLSSKVVAAAKLLEEGKLQLPLYMEAVRGMGLEPIGGLYHPLGATRDDRPRGLLAAEHKGALVPDHKDAHVRTDFLDDESFDDIIEDAVERAGEIVGGIRAGQVGRNPRGGKCPRWCAFAPICRMERAVIDPDEEEEEDAR